MSNSKKQATAKVTEQDPLNPRATWKGKLVEVLAFYPSTDTDPKSGRAFGYGLVAENTLAAKYVATVAKPGDKQLLADPSRNAEPSKHQQYECVSCKKHIRIAELATTVAKREAKLKADPTAKVGTWRTCPPCRTEQEKRAQANQAVL